MAHITFYKYQGTGNDFILIDNRNLSFDRQNHEIVRKLCDRRFGIGADGLMLLQPKEGFDFEMVYYNADGRESSMCGNGGRCVVAFADLSGIHKPGYHFIAPDGPHDAILSGGGAEISVKLKMADVSDVTSIGDDLFLDTGSPHFISFVKELKKYPVKDKGAEIRYSNRFKPGGTNVNFVEVQDGSLFVRTFERGVEDETYSCGTGVTAAAIGAFHKGLIETEQVRVKTLGGNLNVYFEKRQGIYTNVWLEGPAVMVFKGETDV